MNLTTPIISAEFKRDRSFTSRLTYAFTMCGKTAVLQVLSADNKKRVFQDLPSKTISSPFSPPLSTTPIASYKILTC